MTATTKATKKIAVSVPVRGVGCNEKEGVMKKATKKKFPSP